MAFSEDHNLAQAKLSSTSPKDLLCSFTHNPQTAPTSLGFSKAPQTPSYTPTLHMPLREMDGTHPHPSLRQASRCKTAGEARGRVPGKARDEWKEVGPGDVKDAQEKAIHFPQEYYGAYGVPLSLF